jgi:hypothetical protein
MVSLHHRELSIQYFIDACIIGLLKKFSLVCVQYTCLNKRLIEGAGCKF